MGYKLGIGLLLFGILLSNIYDGLGIFSLASLLFGLIGLILVIAACSHDREKKENRTEQYEQNNTFVQNDANQQR